MAVTINTDRINDTVVYPRSLVEIDTTDGTLYLSTEPFVWSGKQYLARVLDVGAIATANGADFSVPTAKSITITLANADGFMSRQPQEYWRGQALRIKEILANVESYALRSWAFTITGTQMNDSTTFTLQGEEYWATYRRRLVPNVLITKERYPYISDSLKLNPQPIPLIYGRCMAPLILVDNRSQGDSAFVFLACVGSATLMGDVKQHKASNVGAGSQAGDLTTYSGSYSVRYRRISGDIPVTELVLTGASIGGGDAIDDCYADLAFGSGTPDRVLVDLLTNPWAGAGVTGMNSFAVVDSVSLAAANSFYVATTLSFDCALTTARPFEDWLGDWMRDSMTRVNLRDQIYLTPVGSQAIQGTFDVQNVLNGSLRMEDIPLSNEVSRWNVQYRERTRGLESIRSATWNAGNGADAVAKSLFIGRQTVAQRIAQTYAKRGNTGIRRYAFRTTVVAANMEDGDLCTILHPHVGATPITCELDSTTRKDGLYDLTLRQGKPDPFVLEQPGQDLPFQRTYQRVVAGSYAIPKTPTVATFTGSHNINQLPGYMKVIPKPGFATTIWENGGLVSASYDRLSSTGSTFVVQYTGITSLAAQDMFLYFDLGLDLTL